jgi:hypothetical protein
MFGRDLTECDFDSILAPAIYDPRRHSSLLLPEG